MILFDLDGTLVDTAHDLAYALNLQRQQHGLTTLPFEAIRPYASHGSKGVVTNKPRRFTQPLLENIGLLNRAKSVVCADDAARPKPYPDSLYLACEQAGVSPDICWYVGDAERDIEAGRAAGMYTVVAMYGYLGATDNPQAWGADVAIDTPLELLNLIHDAN
ncbi:MAG: hypothetical protein B7Y34_03145 [Methylophilales bacterium 16-45-9]|nr:MAG: hypothetical protein B7Y34_03145 [Methylophilales bacterium 16-45-9]